MQNVVIQKNLPVKGTFIRIYRLQFLAYILSRWYFQSSFVICTTTLPCCPSPLLSGSTPPPLPYLVWISILKTSIQCVRGVWGSGPQTDKHLPQNPYTGQFFRWRHFATLRDYQSNYCMECIVVCYKEFTVPCTKTIKQNTLFRRVIWLISGSWRFPSIQLGQRDVLPSKNVQYVLDL
jgi:hypothetical protein